MSDKSTESVVPEGHVRVRIAVAVSDIGEYDAVGWSNGRDEDMREKLQEEVEPWMEGGYVKLHWVEVDLPVTKRSASNEIDRMKGAR